MTSDLASFGQDMCYQDPVCRPKNESWSSLIGMLAPPGDYGPSAGNYNNKTDMEDDDQINFIHKCMWYTDQVMQALLLYIPSASLHSSVVRIHNELQL